MKQYSVALELVSRNTPPAYFAFGPYGTRPAIEAGSLDEAIAEAKRKVRETMGGHGTILVRECEPVDSQTHR